MEMATFQERRNSNYLSPNLIVGNYLLSDMWQIDIIKDFDRQKPVAPARIVDNQNLYLRSDYDERKEPGVFFGQRIFSFYHNIDVSK